MTPRTRRSQVDRSTEPTPGQGEPNENQDQLQASTRAGTLKQAKPAAANRNATRAKGPQPALVKRTLGSNDPPTSLPESPPKKNRSVGPSHGRPMPLNLTHVSGERVDEREIVNQQPSGDDGSLGKGKRVELQRDSSFYPGRGDATHVLSYLDSGNFPNPEVDDQDGESEQDDEEQMVELALKYPARFSEAMATEASRPTWKEPGGIDMPRPATVSSRLITDDPGPSGGGSLHTFADATVAPTFIPPLTPMHLGEHSADTPLPKSAPVRRRDTPASTPGPPPTPGVGMRVADPPDDPPSPNNSPAGHATATPESPRKDTIFNRDTDLVFSEGSTTRLMLTHQRPLIRVIIQDAIENLRASLLFHDAFPDAAVAFALTKDAIVVATESHGPGGAFVERRLQADEEYITRLVSLPRARISLFRGEVKERCNAVSVAALIAIGPAPAIAQVVQRQLAIYNYTFPGAPGSMGARGMVRRTLPYRNPRIITVIRDLYFSGGSHSFASKFGHLFPTYQGDDGVVSREVPVPMVALVATALYATLYEWRTGEQQTLEFTTNAYMDVYQGHVGTFQHILDNRTLAFHTMMGDIYTQASTPTGNTVLHAPIADLDLDMLEE